MNPYKSALERAFEMANAGECETVASVITRLNKEGYNGNQVIGRTLVKHLSTLIKEQAARTSFGSIKIVDI